MLTIGAMEGLSLQNVACGCAPRTNGQLLRYAVVLRIARGSRGCTEFINMTIAVVITGNGRKMELRHSRRAVVQWHAGEAIEKDFLTLILDAKDVSVQLIGAMEGLSFQSAACGLSPRANGQLKHLAFCS